MTSGFVLGIVLWVVYIGGAVALFAAVVRWSMAWLLLLVPWVAIPLLMLRTGAFG